jgi:hypothetical protein
MENLQLNTLLDRLSYHFLLYIYECGKGHDSWMGYTGAQFNTEIKSALCRYINNFIKEHPNGIIYIPEELKIELT